MCVYCRIMSTWGTFYSSIHRSSVSGMRTTETPGRQVPFPQGLKSHRPGRITTAKPSVGTACIQVRPRLPAEIHEFQEPRPCCGLCYCRLTTQEVPSQEEGQCLNKIPRQFRLHHAGSRAWRQLKGTAGEAHRDPEALQGASGAGQPQTAPKEQTDYHRPLGNTPSDAT